MMDIIILNESFETMGLLESFKSILWVERFSSYGDFEIYTPVDTYIITTLQIDYYLKSNESDTLMIVEDIQITSDEEFGDMILITGRCLASILFRRIVWDQTSVVGADLQDTVEALLDDSMISPTDTDREISNLVFVASTDVAITALEIDLQDTGGYIYDVIQHICESKGIGFKITYDASDNSFNFELYAGEDRSFDQTTNSFVIFSPEFENVISSEFVSSTKYAKTVSLVVGEGDPSTRKSTTVACSDGAGTGLDRREMFIDAGDISEEVDGVPLSEADYLAQLTQRAEEELANNINILEFGSQVDTTRMYIYRTHFFLGDVVQITNEYGFTEKVQIVEMIQSIDPSGSDTYPTFKRVS